MRSQRKDNTTSNRSGPPRFRGADFLMRFMQGRWAEDRIVESINNTTEYRAVPYGLSQVYVSDGEESIAEYWERFSTIEVHGKRPDVVVFQRSVYEEVIDQISDEPTLMPEAEWRTLIPRCVCTIEAENSLWRAEKMPDKDQSLPLRRKDFIAPTIWVKEEDAPRLLEWQNVYEKPIYVVQVFFDQAYCARLQTIMHLVEQISSLQDARSKNEAMKRLGLIIAAQRYTDSRTGIGQDKLSYRLHPAASIKFGTLAEEPILEPKVIESEKGKLMPYVHFSGGRMELTTEILDEWSQL